MFSSGVDAAVCVANDALHFEEYEYEYESMCVTFLYSPKERPELSVAFEFDPLTSFYNVFYIFI